MRVSGQLTSNPRLRILALMRRSAEGMLPLIVPGTWRSFPVKARMMSIQPVLLLLPVILAAFLTVAGGHVSVPVYEPVLQYDPHRDAEKDIEMAIAEARRSGRRVLLEVGGEWCIWCHRLDDFLKRNKKLDALLKSNFVIVKVNYSPQNKNEAVLSRYPEVAGYPHFFVLDREGKLLHSQDTARLEKGKSYHAKRFKAFLVRWGPNSHPSPGRGPR